MTVDFTLLATGALSFTVALAWNRAVNQWIESRYPLSSPKATASHALAAAIVVTLFVIVLVELLNRGLRYVGPPGPARDWHPGDGLAGDWRPGDGLAGGGPAGDGLAGDGLAGGGPAGGGFAPRRPATPEVLSCRSTECRACAHCFPRPIVTLWD